MLLSQTSPELINAHKQNQGLQRVGLPGKEVHGVRWRERSRDAQGSYHWPSGGIYFLRAELFYHLSPLRPDACSPAKEASLCTVQGNRFPQAPLGSRVLRPFPVQASVAVRVMTPVLQETLFLASPKSRVLTCSSPRT